MREKGLFLKLIEGSTSRLHHKDSIGIEEHRRNKVVVVFNDGLLFVELLEVSFNPT